MKITLIQPENPYDIAYGSGLLRPLSLHLLASYLEKHGFEIEILDLRLSKNKKAPLNQLLRSSDSKVFGITGYTASRFAVVEIVKRIKQTNPSSCVVVGGWHFTHCARETLEKVKDIDIVVKGMGLSSIVEIAKAVSQKKSFEKIHSIIYRNEDRIVENPALPVCVNIDEIPTYMAFSMSDYPEYLRGYSEDIKAIGLYSSLGCPHRCIFCSKVIEGYYLKDTKKFVDEIALFKDSYNIQAFNFVDMTFTGNPRHAKVICQEIISRKIEIKWWCESRVDIPLDILEIMKKAGCVAISVGIESGSNKVLSTISKGTTAEMILNFVHRSNDLGIFLSCFFMYSHLGETRDDVKKTFDLMERLNKYDFVEIGVFQPTMIFPGSRLEMIARQRNSIRNNFSWYDPYDSELNRRLNQIPNIPLFLDIFKPHELIEIHKNIQVARVTLKGISKMEFKKKIVRFIAVCLKNTSSTLFFKAKDLYERLKKITFFEIKRFNLELEDSHEQ